MRVTTLLRKLIGVTRRFFVTGVSLRPRGLVLQVRLPRRKPRCGRCEKVAGGYDRRRLCYWRHPGFARFPVWLACAPRRVECAGCGVMTEEVPWASSESRVTRAFEELTAYLAQITEETAVTKMMGLAWRTVGRRIVRELRGSPEAHEIKGTRFVVLEKPEDLSRPEKEKLSAVRETHQRPDRARLLEETLGDALDCLQPARAHTAFTGWLAWASRPRRKPFVRVAGIIPKRFEGIHDKLRMVARRAFGLHGPGPLIAMLFLTCGGMQLGPPLPP